MFSFAKGFIILYTRFGIFKSSLIEFVFSFGLTVIVIIACLIFSMILRINPLMAHYLFGQKKTINN